MNSTKVLFVCTGNAGRSVMAEVMFRSLAGHGVEIISAGVEPCKNIHPMARKLMAEQGQDISGHRPQHVRKFVNTNLDLVVTIGDRAEAECPDFKSGVRRIYWEISDPADADGTADSERVFRLTHEQIANRLPDLLSILSSMTRTSEITWQPAISTVITHPKCFQPKKHLPTFVKTGFSTIELCYFHEDGAAFPWEDSRAIRNLRTVADDLGVKIWAIHPPDRGNLTSEDKISRVTQLDVIRHSVDIALELGAAVISFHAGLRMSDISPRSISMERLRLSLEELAEYSCTTPVILCLETLMGANNDITNRELLDYTKMGTQSALGVVIDTGHSFIARDLYGMPQLAGRKLLNLHLHDNDGVRDLHRVPGAGSIDWGRVIDDLCAADYGGPLLLEVSPGKHDLETALWECRRAFQNLLRPRTKHPLSKDG